MRKISIVCILLLLTFLARMALGAEAPWPTFGHDFQRSGRSPDYGGPASPQLLWSQRLNAWAFPPVVGADGTIYVSTWNGGKVYAFGADGTLKWQQQLGTQSEGPPTLANGTLYLGVYDSASGRRYLYALNSLDGSVKWSIKYAGSYSPAVSPDGTIYAPSTEGYLQALNPDGTVKWTSPFIGSLYGIIALAPRRQYFCCH